MRKLLFITIVLLSPALGCTDCLEQWRRIEVWKAQNIFAPTQPVVVGTAASAGCAPAAAPAPGCNCQQGGAAAQVETAVPGSVSVGYPTETPNSFESTSTEELDGVLKQP